ncbi:hypothetical protein BLNAU_5130 [Blattamonas nauphoetae]|uniref:FPL domain-containing protein n=1 Tax=Blattamonas nauphoetae TaxID=2049346 RepID=A0ABQ9Y8B9_9EUKA|nr:hypothetical protein BLNAU_5130 [Blattamonas nauphoetae]
MSPTLKKLSSMTRLAGFCSVFVELNGIEELVALKSRFVQENPDVCFVFHLVRQKTFLELIWGLSFYGSEAAIPLLTSPIPNDLVDLLQTSDTGTTELILKTLVNIGVDNRELFRSQLGATLLQSIALLLQKSLPIHHQHLFTQAGNEFIEESPLDTSTELCLKLLILIVHESEQFRLENKVVQFVAPFLRHKSTDIVFLVLRAMNSITSRRDFAETMRTTIPITMIDGYIRSILMFITLIAELFGAYLSRLRTQIEQIQLLWKNEPENAMLLDGNTSSGGTDASEHHDVVKLTTQITATCEVLCCLSHFFDSAVFWEGQLNQMFLDCEILRMFGEFFSFCCETIQIENSLRKQNPTTDLLWMDSRTTIKENTTRILPFCLNGIANLLILSKRENYQIYEATYPQHRTPHQHFFSILSTLLVVDIPNLAQPIVRIANLIILRKDGGYPTLLKSGLIEVLFRYVIAQGIDDEQTEKTLMQIATRILIRGDKGYFQYNKFWMIERDSAYRLYGIKAATLEMLNELIRQCSAPLRRVLITADLIDQLVLTLNPLSISLSDSEQVHSKFLSIISNSI